MQAQSDAAWRRRVLKEEAGDDTGPDVRTVALPLSIISE